MAPRHIVQPRWVFVDGVITDVVLLARMRPGDRPIAHCPLCDEVVVLKLGEVRAYHYAHRAGST